LIQAVQGLKAVFLGIKPGWKNYQPAGMLLSGHHLLRELWGGSKKDPGVNNIM